jgi:methylmalonyl-CoA epimerase
MSEIKCVDHIGIAVKNLQSSIEKFEKILGAKLVAKIEGKLVGERITAAYLKLNEQIIVLDASDDPDSFINRFIEKRGEGINHLGLEVNDLNKFAQTAKDEGLRVVYKVDVNPYRKEMVIHPKSFCGILLQVIEWSQEAGTSFEERIEKMIEWSKKK